MSTGRSIPEAADRRFKVGVNLDGKLFGGQPDERLRQPLLWMQSDEAKQQDYTQGRDRLLAGLRAGGDVLTVRGSVHMSFSDMPSYWTAAGRRLLGTAAAGSISLADMATTTADAISAFVAPALGAASTPVLPHVLAEHESLHAERLIAAASL
jgi:hypothetical protein